MPIISDFPYLPDGGSGAPDYAYTGDSVFQEAPEAGVKWRLILTSSGTLTLNKRCKAKRLAVQGGGGGGGAGYSSGSGSDGADGAIETLENQSLAPDEYIVTIGAGGSRPTDAKGGNGGQSAFGDLLTASGGTGGAYRGGSRGQSHSGLYEKLGQGGQGGSSSDYTGSITTAPYLTVTRDPYAYKYKEPSSSSWNEGSVSKGQKVRLESTTQYDSTSGDSSKWYKLYDGTYMQVSAGTVSYETLSDTRRWFGNAGNPGVVLLEG